MIIEKNITYTKKKKYNNKLRTIILKDNNNTKNLKNEKR